MEVVATGRPCPAAAVYLLPPILRFSPLDVRTTWISHPIHVESQQGSFVLGAHVHEAHPSPIIQSSSVPERFISMLIKVMQEAFGRCQRRIIRCLNIVASLAWLHEPQHVIVWLRFRSWLDAREVNKGRNGFCEMIVDDHAIGPLFFKRPIQCDMLSWPHCTQHIAKHTTFQIFIAEGDGLEKQRDHVRQDKSLVLREDVCYIC